MPPNSDFVTGRSAAADYWIAAVEGGVNRIDIETVEIAAYDTASSRVGRATLFAPDGSEIDRVKFVELWHRKDGEWRIQEDIWNSTVEAEA